VRAIDPWQTDSHRSVARLVTQKSIVLLKNASGLLPLDRAALRSVAVIGPRAKAIAWTQENVPAIVHMTHNSQETGNALADVLFGDYNPGGRLVQTWPRPLAQLPAMMDYGIRHGGTYIYFSGEQPGRQGVRTSGRVRDPTNG
jgi:beta-glucosidase-like glycosyl hydrolase